MRVSDPTDGVRSSFYLQIAGENRIPAAGDSNPNLILVEWGFYCWQTAASEWRRRAGESVMPAAQGPNPHPILAEWGGVEVLL